MEAKFCAFLTSEVSGQLHYSIFFAFKVLVVLFGEKAQWVPEQLWTWL